MSPLQILLLIFGCLLLLVILVLLLFQIYFHGYIFKYKCKKDIVKKVSEFDYSTDTKREWMMNLPKKRIYLEENKKLFADLMMNETPSHKYVIFSHGYRSNIYGLNRIADLFYKKGYNMLCVTSRGHKDSKYHSFTMGCKEHKDLGLWAHKIARMDPLSEIVLHGWSMGGNCTMEASGLDLPKNVICAISDCGYTSCYDQLVYMIDTYMPKLPRFLFKLQMVFERVIFNNDTKFSAVDQLSHASIPVIFIHGTKDRFVPFYMLDKCYNACSSKKERHVFEGATHCDSFYKEPERYEKIIFDFIEKCKKE